MNIATALAISARALEGQADRLCLVALSLAARSPERACAKLPATRELKPESADDSGNLAVLLAARARLTRAIRLLEMGT